MCEHKGLARGDSTVRESLVIDDVARECVPLRIYALVVIHGHDADLEVTWVPNARQRDVEQAVREDGFW